MYMRLWNYIWLIYGRQEHRNRQQTSTGDDPMSRSLAQLQIAAENGHIEVSAENILDPRGSRPGGGIRPFAQETLTESQIPENHEISQKTESQIPENHEISQKTPLGSLGSIL